MWLVGVVIPTKAKGSNDSGGNLHETGTMSDNGTDRQKHKAAWPCQSPRLTNIYIHVHIQHSMRKGIKQCEPSVTWARKKAMYVQAPARAISDQDIVLTMNTTACPEIDTCREIM